MLEVVACVLGSAELAMVSAARHARLVARASSCQEVPACLEASRGYEEPSELASGLEGASKEALLGACQRRSLRSISATSLSITFNLCQMLTQWTSGMFGGS